MEAKITARRSIETFRTALILGGIIVAMLTLPFLMHGDFNASVVPHLNFSPKEVIHQTNAVSVKLIHTVANTLF